MPLDTETAEFLAQSRDGKPAPPPWEVSLEEFRAAVEPFRALSFDIVEMAEVRELNIPSDAGPDVGARLYIPDTGQREPVIVWAHGGSWVRVTVDLMDAYLRFISDRSRCAVLAVDYQLAPEARFPTAIHEVCSAIRWIREHGKRLDIDPGRIAVGGESSGGQVAAAAAMLSRDRDDLPSLDFQALMLPLLDVTLSSPSWDQLGEDYLLTKPQLQWALQQYAPEGDPTDPLLSPLHADSHAGLAPALVLTGEYDPLRDDGKNYADKLRASDVAVEHIEQPSLIHHAPMAPRKLPAGRDAVESVAAAINRALHT
ncbi:Acetyl esterase/lipase [Haloechinothrix alba]|uniref:Acetyl esterase/lipase n=1 Tax=Haloechinothrix alba TaxID=664784 RepID=A0A239AH16_9PSEU|nr:alpha/beta hydrolase [Haloechinothrix alba]SNR94966.1 Acetyl esterase/lipase [Haloechinothrix alba]